MPRERQDPPSSPAAPRARKSIGDAAQETGLSVHTLRYYERAGLICRVRRGRGGRREYAPENIAWFAFLRRLRAAGMSIRTMHEFARLQQRGATSLSARLELLRDHQADLARRIAALCRMQDDIDAKVRDYERAVRERGADVGRAA